MLRFELNFSQVIERMVATGQDSEAALDFRFWLNLFHISCLLFVKLFIIFMR